MLIYEKLRSGPIDVPIALESRSSDAGYGLDFSRRKRVVEAWPDTVTPALPSDFAFNDRNPVRVGLGPLVITVWAAGHGFTLKSVQGKIWILGVAPSMKCRWHRG